MTQQLRWGVHGRFDASHGSAARELIITAAMECYARTGLATNGLHIAEEAKVTRPTVYRYFDSVEMIRRAVVERIWDNMAPKAGAPQEWLEALQKAREYRLGPLLLTTLPIYEDLETVILTHAETLEQEGCARLFLSLLHIESINGSPLPLFEAMASTQSEPHPLSQPSSCSG